MRFSPIILLLFAMLSEESAAQARRLPVIAAKPVETQEQAVAAIKKLGGTVTFDEKNPNKPVISVDFRITMITDEGLEHLKELTNLRTLNLYNTKVTDAGLVHLNGLTNLRTLILDGTKVSDAGLVHLKGLTNLRRTLSLSRTKGTDSGLVVHLRPTNRQRTLSLNLLLKHSFVSQLAVSHPLTFSRF